MESFQRLQKVCFETPESFKRFNIHGHIGSGNHNLLKGLLWKDFRDSRFVKRLQKVFYRLQKVLGGPKFMVKSYWSWQSQLVKKGMHRCCGKFSEKDSRKLFIDSRKFFMNSRMFFQGQQKILG